MFCVVDLHILVITFYITVISLINRTNKRNVNTIIIDLMYNTILIPYVLESGYSYIDCRHWQFFVGDIETFLYCDNVTRLFHWRLDNVIVLRHFDYNILYYVSIVSTPLLSFNKRFLWSNLYKMFHSILFFHVDA